eukprot:Ihof_evm4s148 gene=Ihof_evmTU4s148
MLRKEGKTNKSDPLSLEDSHIGQQEGWGKEKEKVTKVEELETKKENTTRSKSAVRHQEWLNKGWAYLQEEVVLPRRKSHLDHRRVLREGKKLPQPLKIPQVHMNRNEEPTALETTAELKSKLSASEVNLPKLLSSHLNITSNSLDTKLHAYKTYTSQSSPTQSAGSSSLQYELDDLVPELKQTVNDSPGKIPAKPRTGVKRAASNDDAYSPVPLRKVVDSNLNEEYPQDATPESSCETFFGKSYGVNKKEVDIK